MKWLIVTLLVLGLVFLIYWRSCGTPENNSAWGDNLCNSERLEFQEVTDTTTITKNGNVTGAVVVNGKAISNPSPISLDEIKAQLNGGGKVLINQKTSKVIKVSEQFWEDFTRNRKALCDIVQGVKNKTISSAEGKQRAENLYLDIITSFSQVETQKTKVKVSDLDLEGFIIDKNGNQQQIDFTEITKIETFKNNEGNWLKLVFHFDHPELIKTFQFNFGKKFSKQLGPDRANPDTDNWSTESNGEGDFIYKPNVISQNISFLITYKN